MPHPKWHVNSYREGALFTFGMVMVAFLRGKCP